MPTSYPSAYDDKNITGNPIRTDLVARLMEVYDIVEAIEHELGLNPSSSFATVVARLDNMQQQITDLVSDVPGMVSAAIDAHTDGTDPHSGMYGKITTPSKANGGGTLFVGGSPSASGPDYDAWVDTSS